MKACGLLESVCPFRDRSLETRSCRLPVAGRKSFPAEDFEGTESVGGENQASRASVLSETPRDVFARSVLWGTQEREASASERSGSGCQTFTEEAVHVELRIPHHLWVGVSTSALCQN
jgi:hypothetical protein